jgi:hypothetical protein
MSNQNSSWNRTCVCGNKYRVSRAEIIKGLGRYCGDECLNRAIEGQKGTLLMWYKLPDPRGVYRAEIRLHKGSNAYAAKNKYFLAGDKDTAIVLIWTFMGGEAHGRALPTRICWKDIEVLWHGVFDKNAEAMFQALLTADEDALELWILQAKLVA